MSHELGVYVSDAGILLTLSDVVAEDTQSQESDRLAGWGLDVESRGTAVVTRAVFSRNREVGVAALRTGTSVQLTDVVVAQTDEQACSTTTCADRPYGIGLGGVGEPR